MLYTRIEGRHISRLQKEQLLIATKLNIIDGWEYKLEKENNIWCLYSHKIGMKKGFFVPMDRKEARALRRFLKDWEMEERSYR